MGVLLAVSVAAAGCAVTQKRAVAPAQVRRALPATKSQLIAAYNEQARAVRTINARVRMKTVTGSAYTGVIEQYHEVGGFILAARPESIRVIGQAPVVAKDIFDMVSDGRTFRIFIPSKNEFIVGPDNLERSARNPIENLRPQHILDALFWPEISPGAEVLFEEFDALPQRYYVLTLLRGSGSSLEIARKIWFDRSDLRVSRIEIFGRGGRLDSDISYSDWQAGGTESAGATASSTGPLPPFPREIAISRPRQDYQITLSLTKLTLNNPISPDHFVLAQPAGTKLIRMGGSAAGEAP